MRFAGWKGCACPANRMAVVEDAMESGRTRLSRPRRRPNLGRTMIRIAFMGALTLMIGGCTGLAAINPGQISGAASGLFGIPAATVSAQVVQELVEIQALAAQLQMLKAQLDGAPVVLPSIPSPVVVNPSPTPVTPVPPPPVLPPAPRPTVP